VDIDKEGRVYNVQNDLVPSRSLARRPGDQGDQGGQGGRKAEREGQATLQNDVKTKALKVVDSAKAEIVEMESCQFPYQGTVRTRGR